jgi:hypothetical protein
MSMQKSKSKIIGDLEPIPYDRKHRKFEKRKLNSKENEEIIIHGWIDDYEMQLQLNFSKQFDNIDNAELYMDKLIKKYPYGEYLIEKTTNKESIIYTNV